MSNIDLWYLLHCHLVPIFYPDPFVHISIAAPAKQPAKTVSTVELELSRAEMQLAKQSLEAKIIQSYDIVCGWQVIIRIM